MNIVADEGIDFPIVDKLRDHGHKVWYVAEMSPGMSDSDVLHIANIRDAILLTNDKDFGDLVFRQYRASSGVILVRLHGLASERKADLVASVLNQYGSELISAFTVLTAEKVRIRPSDHH